MFVISSASQASTDTVTSAADDLEEKPTKKSKKGKRVTWPDDDANLAIFHYFEMDEDERGQFVPLFFENLVYIFPLPVHYLLLNDEFLRYHYWATGISITNTR